mmetsp:Transcript_27793/g.50360  ORF Transcript_27793/g.50360 Transcript_27793/m.50360 type:complete len:290 (+) Transcript_27793:912-1781(+)
MQYTSLTDIGCPKANSAVSICRNSVVEFSLFVSVTTPSWRYNLHVVQMHVKGMEPRLLKRPFMHLIIRNRFDWYHGIPVFIIHVVKAKTHSKLVRFWHCLSCHVTDRVGTSRLPFFHCVKVGFLRTYPDIGDWIFVSVEQGNQCIGRVTFNGKISARRSSKLPRTLHRSRHRASPDSILCNLMYLAHALVSKGKIVRNCIRIHERNSQTVPLVRSNINNFVLPSIGVHFICVYGYRYLQETLVASPRGQHRIKVRVFLHDKHSEGTAANLLFRYCVQMCMIPAGACWMI